MTPPIGQRTARLLLLLGSTLLAVLLGELVCRAILPDPDRYYIWRPGLVRVVTPTPGLMAGVEGPSRFTINADGLRSDSRGRGAALKLLAVGGSTTACTDLDDSEAWPRLLQDLLSARRGRPDVWVGNAGHPGHHTREHVLQVERLLIQHPDTDAVLLLAGVNDLQLRLSLGDAFAPEDPSALSEDRRRRLIMQSFEVYPEAALGATNLLDRSVVWRHIQPLLAASPGGRQSAVSQLRGGSMLARARRSRREAPRLDALPDLEGALGEYRANLRAIAREARARGARPVLITQPALWRADLSPEEEALLWFGWAPDGFYTAAALAEGMDRYNRALLEVCELDDLDCVDLAARVPRRPAMFIDDVHFSEAGARRVAEVLDEALGPLLSD